MPASATEVLADLEALIRNKLPQFSVRYKNEVWSQRLLGRLLKPFNPRFMTDYTTTLYPTVYFPSLEFTQKNPEKMLTVLAHEYVHLMDASQQRVWFSVSYLLPQCLALLALFAALAFLSLWFLLFLLFLGALLPWPSLWRTKWEMRGYAMSMAVDYWRFGTVSTDKLAFYSAQFTGWGYYRMCPSQKSTVSQLEAWYGKIKDSQILVGGVEHSPYRDVYLLLKNKGLANA